MATTGFSSQRALSKSRKIAITVNRQVHTLNVEPRETLAEVLRYRLSLTGTKLGCNRAECGTCTVIMDGETVFSCSVLAVAADGRVVETIEGLDDGPILHPIQEKFILHDALQCGYCIPGMIMSCKNLLDHNIDPSPEDVRSATEGNYCRCGAYPNIIAATLDAAKKIREMSTAPNRQDVGRASSPSSPIGA